MWLSLEYGRIVKLKTGWKGRKGEKMKILKKAWVGTKITKTFAERKKQERMTENGQEVRKQEKKTKGINQHWSLQRTIKRMNYKEEK